MRAVGPLLSRARLLGQPSPPSHLLLTFWLLALQAALESTLQRPTYMYPPSPPPGRRKNDPLDFVALMEAQEAAEEPQFELQARRAAGEGRRRRAKPAAKTLLPEDHHYKVNASLEPGLRRWQALRRLRKRLHFGTAFQASCMLVLRAEALATAHISVCSRASPPPVCLANAGGESEPVCPAATKRGGRARWRGGRRGSRRSSGRGRCGG